MTSIAQIVPLNGASVYPGYLDPEAQASLLEEVRSVVRAAPLIRPVTPRGRPMSVRMTAAGRFGWVTGPKGYAYAERHPEGLDWPPIPEMLDEMWRALLPDARAPESCLVNFYGEDARMGMHQDRDEADFDQPVLSVSLGDEALFRVGGSERGGPTQSIWIRSGDVVVLAGAARLAYHGVDRVRFGSSTLLPNGGRINLTLRVVT
ncbi:MAG: alpha-ketoglutarate-dependent dioxygenase AlkB [Pseudomonadota bacterium]